MREGGCRSPIQAEHSDRFVIMNEVKITLLGPTAGNSE